MSALCNDTIVSISLLYRMLHYPTDKLSKSVGGKEMTRHHIAIHGPTCCNCEFWYKAMSTVGYLIQISSLSFLKNGDILLNK